MTKGKKRVVDFIITWTKGIIVAVIIASIIEMILPNGNSKKYIKMVIGVYIVFNIVAPVINKVTNNSFSLESIIDVNKYTNQIESYEVSTEKLDSNNESSIKEIYKINLEKDMKSKLEEKGYIINSINIEINNDKEYTIKSVDLKISKTGEQEEKKANNVEKIEKVNIEVSIENRIQNNENIENVEISEKEKNEIKEYISSTYEVNKKKITC